MKERPSYCLGMWKVWSKWRRGAGEFIKDEIVEEDDKMRNK